MVNKSVDKVIVLGAGYGALGVIKALSRAGLDPILLFSDHHDHACHSRFASVQIKVPNPMDDTSGLLDFLMGSKEGWEGVPLIPTLDEYVIFVAKNSTELKKRYLFTVADWETTRRIINKDLLYLQAQKKGVCTPRFFLPESTESLSALRNELVYPCILKPCESHLFDRSYGRKNFLVHDYQELFECFDRTQHDGLKVMVSEIVPGDDSSIHTYRCYLDERGDLLAEMCTQTLRQYPLGFGQGDVMRTIPMMQNIRKDTLRLLRSFPYHGESSTEFKFDHRTNEYKLMEINCRPVVPESLFDKVGINLSYLTCLDLSGKINTQPLVYQPEVYWIHNYWEVINFFTLLSSGKLNLREFIRPYFHEKVFAVPFLDDPLYFLIETWNNISRALKKLIRRKP
jgi:D-aspartate ligase